MKTKHSVGVVLNLNNIQREHNNNNFSILKCFFPSKLIIATLQVYSYNFLL